MLSEKKFNEIKFKMQLFLSVYYCCLRTCRPEESTEHWNQREKVEKENFNFFEKYKKKASKYEPWRNTSF